MLRWLALEGRGERERIAPSPLGESEVAASPLTARPRPDPSWVAHLLGQHPGARGVTVY